MFLTAVLNGAYFETVLLWEVCVCFIVCFKKDEEKIPVFVRLGLIQKASGAENFLDA